MPVRLEYGKMGTEITMGVLTNSLEAQGHMEPGDLGYWKVWGARFMDVRPGDLVMLHYSDLDEPSEYEVADFAPRGNGHLMDTVRPRFRATTGELFDIGALQPIVLYRPGLTHNILAESVH